MDGFEKLMLYVLVVPLAYAFKFGLGYLLGMGVEWLYGEPVLVGGFGLPWVTATVFLLMPSGGGSRGD